MYLELYLLILWGYYIKVWSLGVNIWCFWSLGVNIWSFWSVGVNIWSYIFTAIIYIWSYIFSAIYIWSYIYLRQPIYKELYCERSEHAFVHKSQSSNSKSRKDNAFETFGNDDEQGISLKIGITKHYSKFHHLVSENQTTISTCVGQLHR